MADECGGHLHRKDDRVLVVHIAAAESNARSTGSTPQEDLVEVPFEELARGAVGPSGRCGDWLSLITDHEGVRALTVRNLAKSRTVVRGDQALGWLDEWQALLDGRPDSWSTSCWATTSTARTFDRSTRSPAR